MNDPIIVTDGHSGSAPIVVPRDLFIRIERIAGRAGMEPIELIELVLSDVFNNPNTPPEAFAEMIRRLAGEL